MKNKKFLQLIVCSLAVGITLPIAVFAEPSEASVLGDEEFAVPTAYLMDAIDRYSSFVDSRNEDLDELMLGSLIRSDMRTELGEVASKLANVQVQLDTVNADNYDSILNDAIIRMFDIHREFGDLVDKQKEDMQQSLNEDYIDKYTELLGDSYDFIDKYEADLSNPQDLRSRLSELDDLISTLSSDGFTESGWVRFEENLEEFNNELMDNMTEEVRTSLEQKDVVMEEDIDSEDESAETETENN